MAVESVYSPEGPMGVPVTPAATRPPSLSGKTVAFVWDYVFRGDEMFPVIGRALRDRFRDVRFVGPDTFGSIFGGDEEAVLEALPSALKDHRVDAVIAGVGC